MNVLFLLSHRDHVRHGPEATRYDRIVRFGGIHRIRVRERGYRIELTPPVPVEVLPGTIRSKRTCPPSRRC
jgi:hypothetical protein